ncbi:MAG TPA: amino acid--[acyl-carrier-protein] ligase [Burkholderiaceae bacterium]|nr:amino acid--[acyl-carrier-protein] ligase [Burkholderiaceae bacterium]
MSERDESQAFHDELVAHGLIIPTGVPGGYGRGAMFEDILARFDRLVMRTARDDGAEALTFPPIVARALIEQVGYMDNFPQLAGSIHSFFGDERAARTLSERVHAGERWDDLLAITDTMLTPAACYPVYPIFSGLLREGGRLVTVMNWVYRHEPSAEPTRLQSFRMREFIRAGTPDQVLDWRNAWLERGLALLGALQLPVRSDVANDPFFGRAGKIMAASQRDQRLKFEILVPVISAERPTAICSFNWHQDHFSGTFGIRSHDGALASTACLGFGLERVTLALLRTHGVDPARWPAEVRAQLWGE